MEWEKIFFNDAIDKGLISKIHKQLLQLNSYINDSFDITPKAWSMKEIIDKPDFIKSKTSALRKTVSRGWEDKPLTGEKFLQKAHLIKGCYLEYTKNT